MLTLPTNGKKYFQRLPPSQTNSSFSKRTTESRSIAPGQKTSMWPSAIETCAVDGLDILLIRSIMNKISHRRLDSKNRLIMKKNL